MRAGLTPLRHQQLFRLEQAGKPTGHGVTVVSAARTVGFDDARMLRPPPSTLKYLINRSIETAPGRCRIGRSVPWQIDMSQAEARSVPSSRPRCYAA
jgi:hypothetical protein